MPTSDIKKGPLYVDSTNNRIGLGTTSPSDNLDVASAAPTLRLTDTDGYYSQIYGGSGSLVFRTDVGQATAGDTMQFVLSGTEAMRIDTSGNLLVGTTDSTPYNNTTADDGVAISGSGWIATSRNNNASGLFNLTGDDGDIINCRKNGIPVGSIGADSGDLYVGTGDTGVRFRDAGDDILPFNPSTGADRNAAIDLGDASARFKDLYLSGGVNFGAISGNVTSKTLDDYEEGTWTPTAVQGVTGFTVSSAGYTKVGRLVTVNFYLNGFTGGDANRLEIGGLPFTSKSATYYTAIFEANQEPHAQARVGTNATKIIFWDVSSNTRASYTGNTLTSHLIGSITYEAA